MVKRKRILLESRRPGMVQECRKCHTIQPLEEFPINSSIYPTTQCRRSVIDTICHVCHRKYSSDWLKNNSAKNRAKVRRHRMRKSGIPGSHTPEQSEQLKDSYGYKCLRCGEIFSSDKLTDDHIIPQSLPHKGATDYIWNIQPLCRPCNSSKGQKIIDYRPLRLFCGYN